LLKISECSRPGGVASVERWFRVLANVDAAALHFVCHDCERCGVRTTSGDDWAKCVHPAVRAAEL